MLSFMDSFSGYNQIWINPRDEEKIAFMTCKGIYCYMVIPFGLKNTGSTYQRLVNLMFKEAIWDFMEVYVDDMIVKSLKTDDHIKNLEASFNIFNKY